jgi:diacylglycerol O-acyltransferase / wax synthase
MNQLRALDASFLYAETPRMPMHIGSVQIFEIPSERRDRFFTEMKQMVRSRSHRLPYLTHRIANAPLQLDHPSWQKCDTDFDRHIERVESAAPGDTPQLERTVAELHERPLDRSQPLWKIYFIEGLKDDRIAYFNVVHHACMDGLAGQAAVDVLTDASPDAVAVPESPPESTPAAISPGRGNPMQRWLDAGAASIADTARAIDALARLGRRALAPATMSDWTQWLAPPTPINRSIGRARSYAMLRVSLTDVKAIGRAHDCSVNDAFLAICGGALRTYLQRKGELPNTSLLAGVPVSVRRPGDDSMNVQVTMMRVALGTHIADPLVRLAAVHASAVDAKALTQDLNALMPAPPRVLGAPWWMQAAARLWDVSGAANYLPPPINVVISNVPGPRATRYSNGARMLTHFPVSIPAHGSGMNITAQSYTEHFDIGITACCDTVPDLARFRDDLRQAYIDIRERVLNRRFNVRALQRPARPPLVERRCVQAERQVA